MDTDQRGCLRVDSQLRTTMPHIFAAGAITGRQMVVDEAVATAIWPPPNAVLGGTSVLPAEVNLIGSFTYPKYGPVGVTELQPEQPRRDRRHDPLVRPAPYTILRCGIVGERTGELAQLAGVAMASAMTAERLALVSFSPYPPNQLGPNRVSTVGKSRFT